MANVEKFGYMKYKDESGNMTTMYPKTKVANVEGLEDWDSAMLLKTVRVDMPTNAIWISVCYGNGKFVAIARNSSIAAYSTDGITWTRATLPASANWSSICYGNNKFVTVANGGSIAAYSTDGITWTQTTLPASADLIFVCYGNGKFVAAANLSKSIVYSTDGITWTQATTGVKGYWTSGYYGGGKFMLFGTAKIAYSTDGINWTECVLNETYIDYTSGCYGNGKFVAVANGTVGGHSTDGITWNQRSTLVNIPTGADVTYTLKTVLGADTILSDAKSYADTAIQSAIQNTWEASY